MFGRPNSWESCLEAASENSETEVVHGWIFEDGEWKTHAWCEFSDRVIDLTRSNHSMPKLEYYLKYKINDSRLKRYTRLKFFELVGDEGHFGPYDEDFFFAETSEIDPLEVIEGRKEKD